MPLPKHDEIRLPDLKLLKEKIKLSEFIQPFAKHFTIAFEKLVVSLLRKMGYGGEIQKFIEALVVAPSNKGIFITTSYYTKGAIEYANNLNGSATLVLIDGKQLAENLRSLGSTYR
ncbi:MAG: restriction endonuclease Mrr [Flavobacteriales bacterium]|jgi:restriction endonuclease Mrr